jgi:hypothetical protein
MNLYEFSDLHSIDIALHYSTNEEYSALLSYVDKYIKKAIQPPKQHKYKPDSHTKSLYALHKCLLAEFPEVKINSGLQYLYAKSVLPDTDLFITAQEIGIKLLEPLPSQKVIDRFYNQFSKLLPYHIEKDYPQDGYKYMILKITLKNNSAQEIVDIIREIIRARD